MALAHSISIAYLCTASQGASPATYARTKRSNSTIFVAGNQLTSLSIGFL